MKTFKIGEVVQITRLTPRAIGFYEKEGIIKPLRSKKRVRIYTKECIYKNLFSSKS